MKTNHALLLLLLCFTFTFNSYAKDSLIRREWKVDGVTREALIHVPDTAKTTASPVVFAFHGHGGSMQRAAKMFGYHTEWPEAIVVYMQGLNTPGQLTDPEGKKPGWQKAIGDQKDRDLKFFDAVLASLKTDFKVESKRIYSTGHSNGGAFTYLLWQTRGEQFAAFAPSAAVGRALAENDPALSRQLEKAGRINPMRGASSPGTNAVERATEGTDGVTRSVFLPKPVLHVAGENDPLVKFTWQKLMMNALRQKNECGDGKPWRADKRCTIYPSKVNAPVVTYIHPGTHKFPEEAPGIIVKFFKEHAKRE